MTTRYYRIDAVYTVDGGHTTGRLHAACEPAATTVDAVIATYKILTREHGPVTILRLDVAQLDESTTAPIVDNL